MHNVYTYIRKKNIKIPWSKLNPKWPTMEMNTKIIHLKDRLWTIYVWVVFISCK